ncbi:MAG: hypothetical protein N2B06_08875, partial [Clostridium sp.]
GGKKYTIVSKTTGKTSYRYMIQGITDDGKKVSRIVSARDAQALGISFYPASSKSKQRLDPNVPWAKLPAPLLYPESKYTFTNLFSSTEPPPYTENDDSLPSYLDYTG